MKKINELIKFEQFYFTEDRGTVFIFLKHVLRIDGTVQAAKCLEIGKIHPTYISSKHSVNPIKKDNEKVL